MVAASTALAVDGIVVNTRNGTDKLQYYGTIDGELWRHDIVNDVVISSTKIHSGPASRPSISPDGKKIAFIKKTGSATAKVAMVDIDGNNEVLLADCLRNSLIDFPHPDWIYFTMGGFHETTSGQIKRVNATTKVVEDVMQAKGINGQKTRIAQLQVSNDLSKAVVRTGDSESDPEGAIVALDLNADDTLDQTLGPKYSCGAGLFADGVHAMDGNAAHDGFEIRKYSDGSVVKTITNADAFKWPPNNGSGDPVDTKHAIFNTGGATNSDRWMCLVTGGDRDYKWHSMMLFNWKEQRCIFVTKGLAGPWDHGDFWEGTPGGTSTSDPPTITQQPTDISVEVGQKATFAVVATGSGTLSYQWQRGGADIVGATQSSYATPPLSLGNGGEKYRCVVSNAHGTATSNEVTLTVVPGATADTTPPTIVAATTSAGVTDELVVMFSEPLDEASAEAKANYAIDGGISVSAADLDSSGKIVTLKTSNLAEQSYTLTVDDVADLAGNKIAPGSTAKFDYSSVAINKPPTVSAGDDQAAYVGLTVTFVGSVVDDKLPAGASLQIAWSVTGGDAAGVSIDDPASPVTSATFTEQGSYELTLTASDGELEASDSVVVVVKAPQSIAIVSPKGGERWEVGSTQTIEWTTVNVDDVMILLTLDDEQTWETIVPSVDVTSKDWQRYPFVVPDALTDKARIKIEAYVQGEAAPPVSGLFSIVPVGEGDPPPAGDGGPGGPAGPTLDGGCAVGASPPGGRALALLLLLLLRRRRS